jgi:hypothetical protein
MCWLTPGNGCRLRFSPYFLHVQAGPELPDAMEEEIFYPEFLRVAGDEDIHHKGTTERDGLAGIESTFGGAQEGAHEFVGPKRYAKRHWASCRPRESIVEAQRRLLLILSHKLVDGKDHTFVGVEP